MTMIPHIEFEYTTEDGGQWTPARGTIFAGNRAPNSADDLEEALQLWGENQEEGIDWDRRVPMLIDGGNVVQAAAVRLGNGRIFDAILGRFDDKAKERAGGDRVEAPEPTAEYAGDEAPPLSMLEQQKDQAQRAWQNQVARAREEAVRHAFEILHARGVIATDPDEIPTEASNGLVEFAKSLPEDVRLLIESDRLQTIQQRHPHTPAGIFERGWVVLDPGVPPYEIPPEDSLSGWEIRMDDVCH